MLTHGVHPGVSHPSRGSYEWMSFLPEVDGLLTDGRHRFTPLSRRSWILKSPQEGAACLDQAPEGETGNPLRGEASW